MARVGVRFGVRIGTTLGFGLTLGLGWSRLGLGFEMGLRSGFYIGLDVHCPS